jgi:hypothetical protein
MIAMHHRGLHVGEGSRHRIVHMAASAANRVRGAVRRRLRILITRSADTSMKSEKVLSRLSAVKWLNGAE